MNSQMNETKTVTCALDKSQIDCAKVFLTYMAVSGDLEKTAYICNLPLETVTLLAAEENYAGKVGNLAVRKKADGEFEKQMNRTINAIQAGRLRDLIDRVIVECGDPEAFKKLITNEKVSQFGSTLNYDLKPLADLAKAAETAQMLSYRALGDTPVERPVGEKGGEGGTHRGIGLDVMKALNECPEKMGISTLNLIKEQMENSDIKKLT